MALTKTLRLFGSKKTIVLGYGGCNVPGECDDGDQYEYGDENDFAGFGVSNAERPSFSDESLKYAKSLSRSPYRDDVINYVRLLPLTTRYKRELYSCIYSLFTEEQVIANNNPRRLGQFTRDDPLTKRQIFAQRDIELARCCSATKQDLLSCNIAGLEKYIIGVYTAYISRTYGDKRERLINNEIGTRSVTQSEVMRSSDVVSDSRKPGSRWSFLRFGGR